MVAGARGARCEAPACFFSALVLLDSQRDSDTMAAVDLPEIPSGDSQAVLSAFNSFRENLDHFVSTLYPFLNSRSRDTQYDKREVLVKLSRDITNLSKKVIFQIHRLATDPNQPATPEEDVKRKLKAAKKAYEALEPVKGMWEGIGRELQGEDFWRFQRSMCVPLLCLCHTYNVD